MWKSIAIIVVHRCRGVLCVSCISRSKYALQACWYMKTKTQSPKEFFNSSLFHNDRGSAQNVTSHESRRYHSILASVLDPFRSFLPHHTSVFAESMEMCSWILWTSTTDFVIGDQDMATNILYVASLWKVEASHAVYPVHIITPTKSVVDDRSDSRMCRQPRSRICSASFMTVAVGLLRLSAAIQTILPLWFASAKKYVHTTSAASSSHASGISLITCCNPSILALESVTRIVSTGCTLRTHCSRQQHTQLLSGSLMPMCSKHSELSIPEIGWKSFMDGIFSGGVIKMKLRL
nr:hypothetical protein CFP56_07391 [Quercus suber]